MSKTDVKAVVIGKACFIDFNEFAAWCFTEEADEYFSIANLWTGVLYELQGKIPGVNVSDLFDKSKKKDSHFNYREKNYIKPLKDCLDYINTFKSPNCSLSFQLLYEHPMFDIIAFGKSQFLIPVGQLYKEPFKDYSQTPLFELRQGSENNPSNYSLIAAGSGLSRASLNSQKLSIDIKKKEIERLACDIDDVQNARKGELAKLQAEIDRQMAILQEKKDRLLEELNTKKADMEAMKEKLERELFMLESEIYSIRCFLGEVIDFIQISSGSSAPVETPVTLFQKIRFLDEELGKAISFYDFNFGDYKLFEQLLGARADIVELFCPNEKCVSLVRVSKTGKAYGYFDTPYGEILDKYDVYHGTKIGVLVRNGENLYFGWTDDEKINIPDDLFFTPDTKVISEDESQKVVSTSIEEAVSRYFIFSILQGLLENKRILSLPEGVRASFMQPSPYIVYSAADAWLSDNRYGSFRDIVDKVNSKISVGDYILSLERLSDGHYSSWSGSHTCERDHNYSNRTRDVHFADGEIYKINLAEPRIDGDGRFDYYVSLIKGWQPDYVYRNGDYFKRQREARANFLVYPDEFINLTYMNSVWLKYVITTRNLGFNEKSRMGNYAETIRYLNKALDFVREREKEELELIQKYCSSIETDSEWPVRLSEWKLNNNVRNITDYQAKRFARTL